MHILGGFIHKEVEGGQKIPKKAVISTVLDVAVLEKRACGNWAGQLHLWHANRW